MATKNSPAASSAPAAGASTSASTGAATAAPAKGTKAAASSVNGQPAELPTPGTEVGMTPGGAVIKASGVDPSQSKEQVNFKDAGKAFLAGLPDKGAANAPELTTAEAITAAVQATQGAPAAAGAAPGAAATDPAAADAADDLPPEGELAWDPVAERWRDHAGKFVVAAPPTAEELAVVETANAEAAAAGAPQPVKIVLPGITERGEQDLEVEIDDPALATRLQQLANNGLRRKAFEEQRATVEARAAELDAVEQALTVDPVGFALGHMTKERQIEVARALVLEHFDTLLPDLAKWDQDAASRERERVNVRDRMSDSSRQLRSSTEAQQRSVACMRAAESLIPENTDPAVVQAFVRDAERDLIDALRAGRLPTPELVPQLLAHRIALYGFASSEPAGAAAAGTSATSSTALPSRTSAPAPAAAAAPATARPVSDRARAIAAQVATASSAQARIRRIQTARRSAASVAPAGVGAATVSVPVVPAGADVRAASKALRQKGLQSSWTPA